jgi:hypothetical protein
MNQTVTQKTETVRNTEQPLHTVESRVSETRPDQMPNATDEQVEIDNSKSFGSAQAIQEERQEKSSQGLIYTPSDAELSYIATLQKERLGNEPPSAGFGSTNLPFAK